MRSLSILYYFKIVYAYFNIHIKETHYYCYSFFKVSLPATNIFYTWNKHVTKKAASL